METKEIISTSLFKKVYSEFDRLVKSKGYKTGQGNTYQTAVKEFLIWMENKNCISLLDINSANCEAYYEFLIARKNKRQNGTLSNTSINHHLFGLRIFVDHLWHTEQITHIVAIAPNHEVLPKEKYILTREEIELLYSSTTSLLEVALLSLAYGCGLRRQELCDLNLSDISFQKSKLVVRNGKGNKTREVPLCESVKTHLRNYSVQERIVTMTHHGNFYPHFLITPQGRPVNGNFLNRQLSTLIAHTQIEHLITKNLTLHSLRHCIATHLAENGAEIEFIRDFLGHDSTDTSSLYMVRRKRKSKYLI